MKIIKNIADIRNLIKEFRAKNFTIGLVPTMGALHIGHESLIERAKEECDAVIVSLFVNPTQFCPGEDFDKYPRQLEADSDVCSRLGVDVIFAPTAEEMYPSGMESLTEVIPPSSFQDKLCGKSRKGHFNGVALVVLKLFNIVTPDKAYFGQKDAQQLAIIKKMVQDLDVNTEVIGCPIIRDADGLACSSRNKYLNIASREKALSLNKALKKVKELYDKGEDSIIEKAKEIIHHEAEVEYFKAVALKSFEYKEKIEKGTIIVIAVKIDGVRLIDNMVV